MTSKRSNARECSSAGRAGPRGTRRRTRALAPLPSPFRPLGAGLRLGRATRPCRRWRRCRCHPRSSTTTTHRLRRPPDSRPYRPNRPSSQPLHQTPRRIFPTWHRRLRQLHMPLPRTSRQWRRMTACASPRRRMSPRSSRPRHPTPRASAPQTSPRLTRCLKRRASTAEWLGSKRATTSSP